MARLRNPARPIGWLTVVGLVCLASTALIHRAKRSTIKLPRYVYRNASDLERQCYA